MEIQKIISDGIHTAKVLIEKDGVRVQYTKPTNLKFQLKVARDVDEFIKTGTVKQVKTETVDNLKKQH